jgi:hypothetical protein
MQEFGYFRFLLWNSGMADEPINLVLEHLKAIRADVHEIKHVQQEQGQRQIRMELALAALRRD